MDLYPDFISVCVAATGVCVFRASTSVGALFLFAGDYDRQVMMTESK